MWWNIENIVMHTIELLQMNQFTGVDYLLGVAMPSNKPNLKTLKHYHNFGGSVYSFKIKPHTFYSFFYWPLKQKQKNLPHK